MFNVQRSVVDLWQGDLLPRTPLSVSSGASQLHCHRHHWPLGHQTMAVRCWASLPTPVPSLLSWPPLATREAVTSTEGKEQRNVQTFQLPSQELGVCLLSSWMALVRSRCWALHSSQGPHSLATTAVPHGTT